MNRKTSDSRAERAAKPAFERQLIMKNMFVGHDRFVQTTTAISEFHLPVEGGVHDFGSLFALAGDPRTGKSEALKRYADRFPHVRGEKGMERPVVYVEMPIEGRRRAVLDNIAEKLNSEKGARVSDDNVESGIFLALRDQKVQLLILDEYQEAFTSANSRIVRQCNGLVRKILNLRTANIIVAGLLETYRMMGTDRQLRGRGMLPHFIVTHYEWGNNEERNVFRLLCDEFDDRLPFLEKSGLGSYRTAQRLYWVTDGTIGAVKDFLFLAGCRAMNDGAPKILDEHFAMAWDRIKPAGITFNPFRDDMGNAPQVSHQRPPKAPSGPSQIEVSFAKAH